MKSIQGSESLVLFVPLRTSTIGSAAEGRVLKFLVKQGDDVEAGQPLAVLRTDTLKIELAAAQAGLELYQHQLAELKNGSLPEEIAEARANVLGAKAAQQSAAKSLRRVTTLQSSGAISESNIDDARERAELTRQTLSAMESLFKRVKEGPRVEKIAQAGSQVQLQQQRVNLIIDRMEKFTIRAPFDGYVSMTYTEVGAWLSQGDPVAQVVQLDEVEVEAPVTAEDIVHLRPGDTIRVEFPERPEQLVTGTIDRIVPVADERARTFPTFIRIENRVQDGSLMLMSGMLVRVDMPAGKRRSMPLVPKDALVLNASKRSVFVVSQKDLKDPKAVTVREVPVSLGVAVGGRIQVLGDIQADDLVVVVGNERLRDGDAVSIQNAQDVDETK